MNRKTDTQNSKEEQANTALAGSVNLTLAAASSAVSTQHCLAESIKHRLAVLAVSTKYSLG